LQRNVERDHKVNEALREAGWRVVRAWEHENDFDVVARVVSAVGGEARPAPRPQR
jgi:DNA mismatch endonuclease (patch repair protein)